jgi:hypothetical protein
MLREPIIRAAPAWCRRPEHYHQIQIFIQLVAQPERLARNLAGNLTWRQLDPPLPAP